MRCGLGVRNSNTARSGHTDSHGKIQACNSLCPIYILHRVLPLCSENATDKLLFYTQHTHTSTINLNYTSLPPIILFSIDSFLKYYFFFLFFLSLDFLVNGFMQSQMDLNLQKIAAQQQFVLHLMLRS